jgi:hypothetical protein
MDNTGLVNVAARGQQLVSLLLTTVPLAERMLLYNLAIAAWVMLPERGVASLLRRASPTVD